MKCWSVAKLDAHFVSGLILDLKSCEEKPNKRHCSLKKAFILVTTTVHGFKNLEGALGEASRCHNPLVWLLKVLYFSALQCSSMLV